MREWKCKICGQWLSMAHMRHQHVRPRQMTLAEMRAAREADETANLDEMVSDTWTPSHETREAPDA